MEFTLGGVKHVLRGLTKTGCKEVKGSHLSKPLADSPQIALLQLQEIPAEQNHYLLHHEAMFNHISASGGDPTNYPDLQSLLGSFDDLFAVPTGLPPFREGSDHKIPLEVGANPVNLKPYRCSTLQKDAIDEMVRDMLKQGIIQCSSSPYASPIVLVKKKDGSWRMCTETEVTNQTLETYLRCMAADFVYLNLQPYRQHSLKKRNIPHKLSPRFYGPFRVADKVGLVAYKLEPPNGAAIDDVLHVSQLKLCPNPSTPTPALPQYLLDVGQPKEPEAILDKNVVQYKNKAVIKEKQYFALSSISQRDSS